MTTACMGGWCRIRERCPHYTEAVRSIYDADRLCIPGADGVGECQPIRITLPAGEWERKNASLLRRAGVFDGLVAL